jgi:hypothetical protein
LATLNSIQKFLSGLIDYAGLFPPASLPLDKSISNFNLYMKSQYHWMLSQFIIPVKLLHSLDVNQLDAFSAENPLQLSILPQLNEGEIDEIYDFLHTHPQIKITGCEVKINNQEQLKDVELYLSQLKNRISTNFSTFYEVDCLSDNWENNIEFITDYISLLDCDDGFKLRCGGVEAFMFPPSNRIVYAMEQCKTKNIPMKFTAGLHHPIRHYHSSVHTKMYGFFNIFLAGMYNFKYSLSETDLITIIEIEDAKEFTFVEDEIKWRDYSLTSVEIEKFRNEKLISYGSCSFDEPCEDLTELGLL